VSGKRKKKYYLCRADAKEYSNNFALIFRYVRAAKSVESGGGIHIGVRPH